MASDDFLTQLSQTSVRVLLIDFSRHGTLFLPFDGLLETLRHLYNLFDALHLIVSIHTQGLLSALVRLEVTLTLAEEVVGFFIVLDMLLA